MEEIIAHPHFGGLLGEMGVREKSFLWSRVQPGLARLASFYSITVNCTVFSGVRHVCHDNDG